MADDSPGEPSEDDEFIWQDEQLESASRDELVAHVSDLQDRVESVESEVADLRETLFLLLDLQVGRVDPDDLVQTLEESDP